MSDKKSISKFKVYSISLLIYLLVNALIFELIIAQLESQFPLDLQGILPFTRIAFLLITLLIANSYLKRRNTNTKQKRKPYVVLKWIILMAIFTGLALGVLSNIKGGSASAVTDSYQSREFLEDNKEQYAKCYNSLNMGMVTIGSISFEYVASVSWENRSKVNVVNSIEEEYKKIIKDECQEKVEQFEATNAVYEKACPIASLSALDRIAGKDGNDEDCLDYGKASVVTANGGLGATNMIFTEQEARQYFEQRLQESE